MPRNVEIKARLMHMARMHERVAELAASPPEKIVQDDTFFRAPEGRLKLRVFANGVGELIYYRRADTAGPKQSYYLIAPAENPDALREVLARAYGVAGRVRKVRTLFLIGRTRVHLDRVEQLGDFLELEVVLEEGEHVRAGEAEARHLLELLGIRDDQLVEGSYFDLISEPGIKIDT